MTPNLPDLYDSPDGRLRVALCQVHTAEWDVAGNTARTLAALAEAGRQGADLAITPECVFHGYGFGADADDTRRRCAAIAVRRDGPALAAVRAVAREHAMQVVLGFVEAGAGGALYDAAAIFGADGALLDVYHKVHCRPAESTEHHGPYTPGDRFVTTDFARRDVNCRVGTMICFDREVPESARCLRALGAHVLACPMAWYTEALAPAVNYAHNETITRCRAAENEVFIAVVNHAGRFNGGSFVVGPSGEALGQLGAAAEVRVVELPVMALQARVRANPCGWMGWGFRRPAVYAPYLHGPTPTATD